MNRFCKGLRKHVTKKLTVKKDETNDEKKLHCEQKVCYICKKEFSSDDKKHFKVKYHFSYIGKNIEADLRNKTPKKLF